MAHDISYWKDFYRYPEKYRVDPFRIFGSLYYVGNKDVGAYLIDTGDGLILIDTTFPTTDALLVQSIWQAGFNPKDIVFILHTHGHFDHFGATRLLTSLSGAKTFLGARDAKMFRERPELTLLDSSRYSWVEVFTPDVELEGGECIVRGNVSIRVVATPGHCDGVMSYFFELTEQGAPLTAGLFGGVGFNTLHREFIARYGNTHSPDEFLESLAKVRYETVDITLGNHAAQNHTVEKREAMLKNPTGPNPFIDRGEWGRFIDDLAARLRQIREAEGF
jgi:metallo-beta-lactamase class B